MFNTLTKEFVTVNTLVPGYTMPWWHPPVTKNVATQTAVFMPSSGVLYPFGPPMAIWYEEEKAWICLGQFGIFYQTPPFIATTLTAAAQVAAASALMNAAMQPGTMNSKWATTMNSTWATLP